MQVIDPGTHPELWQGAVRWTPTDDGWQGWRLLPEEEKYAYAPVLFQIARSAAGLRFVAEVSADWIEVEITGLADPARPLDILVDGELATRAIAAGRITVRQELAAGSHRVEIWLPHAGPTVVHAARVPDDATVTPIAARTRWLTYGSSITQAGGADGPSLTWPSIVARTLDWDLTCLGFSGQCHLDPAALATIAATEADVISLCLGINIQGNGSFNERSLPGQLSAFVRGVRAAHPDIPILVISPIISTGRETTPNMAGLSLSVIREMVTQITTDLQAAGDTQLHLVNGMEIFGADDLAMLPDDLHPNSDGYGVMGERLAPRLAQLV